MACTDRNVKVRSDLWFADPILKTPQISRHDGVYFAEVKFYFTKTSGGETQGYALVSMYSLPSEHLLNLSSTTLIVCRYRGDAVLVVIDVKSIISVVAMVPFPFAIDGDGNQYFMMEHVGLDIVDADIKEDIE